MPDDSQNPSDPQTPPRRIPSRGWYGLAFVLLLVGVAAFSASLNVAKVQVAASLDQLQHFVAPGTAEVELPGPGDYLIYYEKIGSFDGEAFDTSARFPELPKMDIDVVHPATGDYLVIRRATDTGTQMYRGGAANSEFGFTAPPPGTPVAPPDNGPADSDPDQPVVVQITLTHENDIDDRLLMAVGPPVVQGNLFTDWRGPFGGAAVLAFTFTFSALIVLLTWVLRHGKVTRRDG